MRAAVELEGGAVRLFHGDALDILPELAGIADCVVSDVPYRLSSGGDTTRRFNGWRVANGYKNNGRIVPCDIEPEDYMGLLFAACAENADAYFLADDTHIFRAHAAAEAAGWRHHNLLVWDKGSVTPNRWYMQGCEFTAYMFKGLARTISDPSAAQLLTCPNPVGKKDHPTQKPVALMAEYIRQSTAPGDVVLDPFMGSGTTGVAAVQLGRRFVGIELDEGYFHLSCERISAARRQPGIFPPAAREEQTSFDLGDVA